MALSFKLFTLGCKVNQYDTAALERALTSRGLQVSNGLAEADVLVVNTCTVTASADRQNRQLLRKLRRANPCALVVVTGCQAEAFPQDLKNMAEVDLVVGNEGKDNLPGLVEEAVRGSSAPETGDKTPLWDFGIEGLPDHTRAFMKVQDGCDACCTYCIVPRTRGRSRSRGVDSILRELRRFEQSGVKEIVVTGVHLGLYGRDLRPPSSLVALVDQLLGRSSIPRIRLSSLEPLELDDGLAALIRDSDRLCPHLHVPLQSGDDGILRRMGRPYDTAAFRERVQRAIDRVPDLTLGCDVMVGFPGETNRKFENTLRFLQSLPFTYLHVFPFSARPGTPAANFDGRISSQEIKHRSRILRKFSGERRIATMRQFVGRSLPVLLERPFTQDPKWLEGWSANYLRARVKGPRTALNQIKTVAMDGVYGTHLLGRLS